MPTKHKLREGSLGKTAPASTDQRTLVPFTLLQNSLFGTTQDLVGWPGAPICTRHRLSGPGAGTHKWKPTLSLLLASYLLWINKGSSPRLSGQFPFTHAHLTAHQSLHSYPKYEFLWSRWQVLPRGGGWYQSWSHSPTTVRIFSQLTRFSKWPWPYLSLIRNHSTKQKEIKQPRK